MLFTVKLDTRSSLSIARGSDVSTPSIVMQVDDCNWLKSLDGLCPATTSDLSTKHVIFHNQQQQCEISIRLEV